MLITNTMLVVVVDAAAFGVVGPHSKEKKNTQGKTRKDSTLQHVDPFPRPVPRPIRMAPRCYQKKVPGFIVFSGP